MNKKVAIMMNGFAALDQAERNEFIGELNKALSGKPEDLRKSLQEAQRTTMNLGPLPTGCPFCGR
jgi:hypothetical protein